MLQHGQISKSQCSKRTANKNKGRNTLFHLYTILKNVNKSTVTEGGSFCEVGGGEGERAQGNSWGDGHPIMFLMHTGLNS